LVEALADVVALANVGELTTETVGIVAEQDVDTSPPDLQGSGKVVFQ